MFFGAVSSTPRTCGLLTGLRCASRAPHTLRYSVRLKGFLGRLLYLGSYQEPQLRFRLDAPIKVQAPWLGPAGCTGRTGAALALRQGINGMHPTEGEGRLGSEAWCLGTAVVDLRNPQRIYSGCVRTSLAGSARFSVDIDARRESISQRFENQALLDLARAAAGLA